MDFYNKPNREKVCFSHCETYRYKRWVKWSNEKPCVFVLLNPASHRETADGHTMRNCIAIARKEKCGGIISVNLCAYIAEDETLLMDAKDNGEDIIGPKNTEYLYDALTTQDALIIVAWGNKGSLLCKEVENFKRIARELNKDVWCLKMTKKYQPHHPARFPVKKYKELEKFKLD